MSSAASNTSTALAIAQEHVEFASDVKRRVAKGGNKSKHILDRHISVINQAISNSKQNVVKALLEARNLEKAKTQTLDIQNNLHRQLLEKLHPNIFFYREQVQDAVKYNFDKPINGEVLTVIDGAMKWNYPNLLQTLVQALKEYSDAEFRSYLSSIPERFLPVSEDLFQQIAALGSKGCVSSAEALQLYTKTKAENLQDSRKEWDRLQNRLCRKILQLYLVKHATPIVLEIEEKLRAHKGFQFVVSKGGTNQFNQITTMSSSTSVGPSSPRIYFEHSSESGISATTAPASELSPVIVPAHRVHSASRLHSSDLNPIISHKSGSKSSKSMTSKKAKNSRKESSITSLSRTSPSTAGGNSLLPLSTTQALAEELHRSQEKQEALKQRMLENMATFVLQHPTDYVHARATHNLNQQHTKLPNKHSLIASSASMTSLPAASSVLLPPIDQHHQHSVNSTISQQSSQVRQPHMAIEQYIKKTSAQKLSDVLYKQVLKLLDRKLLQWKRIHQRVLIEFKCDQVTRFLAAYRLFRWMEWRAVRRKHLAWQQWTTYVAVFEAQERLSAALDIQRCYRGFVGRKRAQMESTARAAASIQQTFRVFFAKKAAAKMRIAVRRKGAVRRIANMWMRYKHILARKKAKHHALQLASVLLIQRIFRGHYYGRKKRQALVLHLRKMRGALKLQTLVRSYRAKCQVDTLRRWQLCNRKVVVLQALVRMALQKRRFQVLLRRHRATLVITYAWWCSRARLRHWQLLRVASAVKLQCFWRCCVARQRTRFLHQQRQQWLAQRQAAILKLTPLFVGYITRRRLRPVLSAYLSRRQQASVPIQCLVRKVLAKRRMLLKRQERDVRLHRHACATRIQAVVRSKIIAYRLFQQQKEYMLNRQLQDPNRARFLALPYYYRLKTTYLSSQDVYHRKYVVKIQCLVRRFLARKRVHKQKRQKSMAVIQSFVSQRLLVASAKAIVAERRRSVMRQRLNVLLLQRMVRGLVARRWYRRTRGAEVVKWGLRELKVRRHIAQAMENFRAKKAYERMYHSKVVQVQSWVRARLGAKRYKKQYRTLVRQRAMRIRAKREKAALVLQCAFRCHRARQKVAKQRVLFAERARELAELKALEESLEGLHGEWMQELLVIRAQTGFRGHMARENFRQKVEEYKIFHKKEQENMRFKAAAKIQALIRGVLSRKSFKKRLPALKKARRALAMCIECEVKPGTRRCRQCRDKYCPECYDLIHAKGHRKEHSWENVTIDARILAMNYDNNNALGLPGTRKKGTKKGTIEGDTMMSLPGKKKDPLQKESDMTSVSQTNKMKVNKADWEEFFDASARAKYWYNKKTGEASWINPFQ